MNEIARHIALTLRSFARQPGMVLIVVLTLALGIGASTALFAYLAAITWPKIDAPEPERVVWIYTASPEEPRLPASYPDFLDLQRQQTAVRDVVGLSPVGTSVGYGQTAAFAWAQMVSGSYFSFFNARPELGRLLVAADDRPGAEPVVVASHFFWKGTLGGDPALIGKPLRLNGQTFTLAGVVPASFRGYGHVPALYIALTQSDRVTNLPRLEKREFRMVSQLGRLAPGVTLEQAGQALALLGRNLDAAAPLETGSRKISVASATSFDPADGGEGSYIDAARVLMAAALLFLLLTCANVANLLLARATVRQREMGIRASLGASRRRLVGTVLSESLLLCFLGGLLGMAFAVWMALRIETYVLTAPGGLGASWAEGDKLVGLDLRVFAFALLVALVCGVLCGLAPVLRVIRGDLLAAVKSDAAGAVGGPSGALLSRKLLVIAQVGLAVLLLLGGSLLVRTLHNAEKVDLGFDPGRILMASLYVPRSAGSAGEGASGVYRRVLEQAEGLPGVESASLTQSVPLAGFAQTTRVTPQEQPDKAVECTYNSVSPGFFDTLGIKPLQGRLLGEQDRRDSPAAVVVSRSLARQLWGEANPVGRILSVLDLPTRPGEPGPDYEVKGVISDTRMETALEPPGPALYFSMAQRSHPRLTLLVRTAASASPASLAPDLRRAVLAAHPDLSIVDLVSGGEQIRRSLSQQRMHAEIAGLFGLLGLGVSVVGLFALLSYTVSLRVRELGVRMAIGARPADVKRLVLRQGMGLVAIGLALGLAGALGLTRLMKSLLYGVAANDPFTFALVALGLTLVTLLACYLPARRAAKLDPLDALRDQ
jgi:putative ABC transport system permease protein